MLESGKIFSSDELCLQGRSRYCVIETTWSNVVAWEGQNITCLDLLKKGDAVDVIGRLKNQRYTDCNGSEHSAYEIEASKLELLNERLTMEM